MVRLSCFFSFSDHSSAYLTRSRGAQQQQQVHAFAIRFDMIDFVFIDVIIQLMMN